MSDGQALLAAILAFPDEDTLRLIYADWLDENGQEARATAIRYGMRRDSRGRRQRAWHVKSWRLAFDHPEWYAPFRLFNGERDDSGTVRWRRGFVESVTCTAADWIAHSDAILAAHPVQRVTLTTVLDDHLQMRSWPSCWPGIVFTLPATPVVCPVPGHMNFGANGLPYSG